MGYVLRPGYLLPPLMFSHDELEASCSARAGSARGPTLNSLARRATPWPRSLRCCGPSCDTNSTPPDCCPHSPTANPYAAVNVCATNWPVDCNSMRDPTVVLTLYQRQGFYALALVPVYGMTAVLFAGLVMLPAGWVLEYNRAADKTGISTQLDPLWRDAHERGFSMAPPQSLGQGGPGCAQTRLGAG